MQGMVPLLSACCLSGFVISLPDFTSRKLCHAHFVDVKTEAHSSVTYPEVHK